MMLESWNAPLIGYHSSILNRMQLMIELHAMCFLQNILFILDSKVRNNIFVLGGLVLHFQNGFSLS